MITAAFDPAPKFATQFTWAADGDIMSAGETMTTAERLGIWVGIWPVTLLVLSYMIEKKLPG